MSKLAYHENESYYFIIVLALTFDKLSKTPISSFVDKSKKKFVQVRLLCWSNLQTIGLISYQMCIGIFNINQLDFGTSGIKIPKILKHCAIQKVIFVHYPEKIFFRKFLASKQTIFSAYLIFSKM